MKFIVPDIETIPQDEKTLIALASEFVAPANLRDPEKIKAAIAKKRADYLADAALNWKTAEVVLIGAGDDAGIRSFTAATEKELISNFLLLVGDRGWVPPDALAAGLGGHHCLPHSYRLRAGGKEQKKRALTSGRALRSSARRDQRRDDASKESPHLSA